MKTKRVFYHYGPYEPSDQAGLILVELIINDPRVISGEIYIRTEEEKKKYYNDNRNKKLKEKRRLNKKLGEK